MNYDEARQLVGGGWHWTTMNDGKVRTTAPCLTIDEPFDPRNPLKVPAPENVNRCQPHATKEEAERHFYDYCLTRLEELEQRDTWNRCKAPSCNALTNKGLGTRPMGLMFSTPVMLCDEHRTAAVFTNLNPFEPGLQLIHS